MTSAPHPFTSEGKGRSPQFLPYATALERETAMLDAVAAGAESRVLIWHCERCIVVPQRLADYKTFPAAARRLEKQGFPVFVRTSGGDAVVQGPGVVNISLSTAVSHQVTDRISASYRLLCAPLMSLLREYNIETGNGSVTGAMCNGLYNVTAMGRKLAGTAQRWRPARNAAHHTMLGHLALSVNIDHAAAVAAINDFYDAADIDLRVCSSAHINISELLSANNIEICEKKFIDCIDNSYTKAINYL